MEFVERGWLLITYRAPKEPSTARVAAWRRLHRLGALYVGPSTCLLPVQLARGGRVTAIAEGVTAAGGTFDVLEISGFGAESEARVVTRFNAGRDAEYAEVVERAEAMAAELRREGERGKYTFAEAEENEADLVKLRRWLRGVRGRDVFGAAGREDAERRLAEAEDGLERFVARSARLEHDEEDGQEDGEEGR